MMQTPGLRETKGTGRLARRPPRPGRAQPAGSRSRETAAGAPATCPRTAAQQPQEVPRRRRRRPPLRSALL